MTYNGWMNRATWALNVWFDLDTVQDVDHARAMLKEAFEQAEATLPPWFSDIFLMDIDAVNWEELRQHASDWDDYCAAKRAGLSIEKYRDWKNSQDDDDDDDDDE